MTEKWKFPPHWIFQYWANQNMMMASFILNEYTDTIPSVTWVVERNWAKCLNSGGERGIWTPGRVAPTPVFETDFIGNIFNNLPFLAGISAIFLHHKIQLVTRLSVLNIPTLSGAKRLFDTINKLICWKFFLSIQYVLNDKIQPNVYTLDLSSVYYPR